jgi:transitional endoplasmic reticulum ATPase
MKDTIIRADIQRTNTQKILVPEKMPLQDAIESLERYMQDEERIVTFRADIPCFPLDGARALMAVMNERFGWTSAACGKVQTLFGMKDCPPETRTFEVGYDQRETVLWGGIVVPGVSGRVICQEGWTPDGMICFQMYSDECKRKEEPILQEIAEDVRRYLSHSSVYRGKAFRITTARNGRLNVNRPPSFIDTSGVRTEDLILSGEVEHELGALLFRPIAQTAKSKQWGVPLKRGILLTGPYGCGKTMTAKVTARLCEEHGWTFISIDRVQSLESALRFAAQYGPAVLFAEDVDRVAEARNEQANDILNTLDGVDTKDADVITVLTTNHPERIHDALLRKGRLDALIQIGKPDAGAREKLIRTYGAGLISDEMDLSEAVARSEGLIPADVAEIVKRAKLYAIGHGRQQVEELDVNVAALNVRKEEEFNLP